MSKDLIVVESPAKVKTIKKFLGSRYMVEASIGHICDLPKRTLGVDEQHDFTPQFEIIPGKVKVVNALKKAAAAANNVFLAQDPDREGEAIAWHVAALLRDKNPHILRIQFNEITARAVREALQHPRPLDERLFLSQQARRVLDRLVGYKLSPLLWEKVKRGISAGRVQSVALRILVERERERQIFKAEEYWVFKADLFPNKVPVAIDFLEFEPDPVAAFIPSEGLSPVVTLAAKDQKAVTSGSLDPTVFTVELAKVDGKVAAIGSEAAALNLEARLSGQTFQVVKVDVKARVRQPKPPFITSTLQQAANQRFGYSSKRTMRIAQQLYEGVDLGDYGTVALITYMRTDSIRIADEACEAAKGYIVHTFGEQYYPEKPRTFKSKSKVSAQDAHEAIRPIDLALSPHAVKGLIPTEQYKLYTLIWERFLASQMTAAQFLDTLVEVGAGPSIWKVKAARLLFPGFFVVSQASIAEVSELPELVPGQKLNLRQLYKEQKFTQPSPHYSEALLVRALDEKGIGRPSTYAAIISTLLDRDYVCLEEKHLVPTDLGATVSELLCKHFPSLMDIDFTATMERSLDRVAEGASDWVVLLQNFSSDFNAALAAAKREMASVKAGLTTDLICAQCGKPLCIRFGKIGQFLACTGYPECRFTSDFVRDARGCVQIAEIGKSTLDKMGICPICATALVLKKARTGSRFLSCKNYPECSYSEPFCTGVPCFEPDCDGDLVEKSSKKGKIFYSCNRYPKCKQAFWDWPLPRTCPKCQFPILTRKIDRSGESFIRCPQQGCGFSEAEG